MRTCQVMVLINLPKRAKTHPSLLSWEQRSLTCTQTTTRWYADKPDEVDQVHVAGIPLLKHNDIQMFRRDKAGRSSHLNGLTQNTGTKETFPEYLG